MRMIMLKPGQDVRALAAELGEGAASVDRLKALNPHLDFARLPPGTVLLVPNAPAERSHSVAGAVFDSLADDVRKGLNSALARVRATQTAADAQRKEVAAALKSASFKKALEGDAELKRQAAEVDERFKADQKLAKQTGESLSALEKMVAAELEQLGKLLR